MHSEPQLGRDSLAAVALDLDGTLVFTRPAKAGSIVIPGRTRSTFLSQKSGELLTELSTGSRVFIASARNGQSVEGLIEQLPDAQFAGFVLECGWVAKRDLHDLPSGGSRQVTQRIELLDRLARALPDYDVVPGYERVVCCVSRRRRSIDFTQQMNHADGVFRKILEELGREDPWRVHQERHKTFFYPERDTSGDTSLRVSKWTGLQQLGVKELDVAAGDDEAYDSAMMEAARLPLALPSADNAVLRLVERAGGIVTSQAGHAGAEELLEGILRQQHAN